MQEEAFFDTITAMLVDFGDISEANYAQFRKTGIQVDGYGGNLSDENGIVQLILVDYSADQEAPNTITKSEIETLLRRCTNFIEKAHSQKFINELEESSEAFGLANTIKGQWSNVLKVRITLITNRQVSKRVNQKSFKITEVLETPVVLNIWDLHRLESINVQAGEREPLLINMSDFDGEIHVLPTEISKGKFETYLGIMPGTVLSDIYDAYGTRLLEQNVRVFLQARGKVNKGIQSTILEEPDMFFCYNNGLTATAEALEVEESDKGLRLKEIRNLQIVNGGQTMASIYHMSHYCKKKWRRGIAPDVSKVFLQMKLSVVPASDALVVVPKISRFSNSQNKVSDADFFSNHPYHVKMEKFSRRIVAPAREGNFKTSLWFYERMRGQYNNAKSLLTDAKKREFESLNPRNQMFTKTDLAKFLTPWEGEPHVAQRGAAKCFTAFAGTIEKAWDANPAFCNEMYFKECIAKAIVFKEIDSIVRNQPWYEGGGTKPPVVLHTIGKLSADLKKKGLIFPFATIWRRQSLGEEMMSEMKSLTTSVSQVVLYPPTHGQLVTEWAKNKSCTDAVSEMSYEYQQSFIDQMECSKEYKEEVREARKDQRENINLNAEIFVGIQEASFWEKLIAWGESREIMNAKDSEIVGRAISGLPTERQSQYIYQVFEKCREAGFRTKPKEWS